MIEIVAKEDSKGKIYFEATEGGGILHWDYSLKNLLETLSRDITEIEQALIDNI